MSRDCIEDKRDLDFDFLSPIAGLQDSVRNPLGCVLCSRSPNRWSQKRDHMIYLGVEAGVISLYPDVVHTRTTLLLFMIWIDIASPF